MPEIELENAANQVKTQAEQIGFDSVRITTADPPAHTDAAAAWLAAGLNGKMAYLEKRHELRSSPLSDARLLEGTRSVILLAISYNFPSPALPDDGAPRGVIARYARGEDYHFLFWERLKQLGVWMEAAWPGTLTRGFADSGPIRERELAARAGMGWQGKHTGLISLDLGNWFLLGALLTTKESPPDESVAPHCGTCTRCLTACPTGALIGPQTMDARRCISYLTIELKGPIPRELRSRMGDHIFGCDDCLAACPWNDRAQAGREMRLASRTGSLDDAYPNLIEWLHLLQDEKWFKERFDGTPMLRPGRAGLRRNVCVALGNIGSADSIAGLTDALNEDISPIVRGHAAWAIGQIAARTGNTIMVHTIFIAALAKETDPEVREEIEAAFAGR